MTGGGALSGFHLGRRETDDLDLFALDDILDDGLRALTAAAAEIGASVEAISTSPDFRRRLVAIAAKDMFVAVADRASISLLDGRQNSVRTLASVPAPGAITGLEVLYDGSVLALDGSGAGWAIDVRHGVIEPLAAKASLVAGAKHVFFVSGRVVSEYDPRKKTATHVATIGSGARSIDTWNEHVAFGLERGEVVLGTRTGAKLETERLTATPTER